MIQKRFELAQNWTNVKILPRGARTIATSPLFYNDNDWSCCGTDGKAVAPVTKDLCSNPVIAIEKYLPFIILPRAAPTFVNDLVNAYRLCKVCHNYRL